MWGADMFKVNLAAAGSQIRIDFAGDLTTLDNQFEVILLFVDEVGKKVTGRHHITNIKATTPRRTGISRVMLPGHNNGDYDYPAPAVRTQMGHIELAVPQNAGMMYLMVIGKAPADVPDSMLVWSPKANYRVDIKTIEAATVAVPGADARFNANLLTQYINLGSDRSAADSGHLEALHKQILADVNTAFASGNAEVVDEYLNQIATCEDTKHLSALQRDLLAQKNFNLLHY
jgi:hypothetical protein